MHIAKLDGESLDSQKILLELLAQHAPEIFSENKIDVKQLRATLGEEVLLDTERYGLNWAGKMDCFRTIQETTTNTLKPVREESVNFDNTENLFIEGDNLEVLKVLQKSYYGKIKMIYIDPPYNTGNDFIYNDKFSRTKKEELIANGSIDEAGNVINHDLYRQNTRDGGHFHSNWLNMMYPRLFLAKNLLKQDGVIFVSIDDNEVHNLRMMMDEIFGEGNFVAQFIWQRKSSPKGVPPKNMLITTHEYIICYAKAGAFSFLGERRSEESFSNPDNDSRGLWRNTNMRSTVKSSSQSFEIIDPKTGIKYLDSWAFSKNEITRLIEENRLIFPNNGTGQVRMKEFFNEFKNENIPIVSNLGLFDGQKVTQDLETLLGSKVFDNPKSVLLLSHLVGSVTKDDIILDFFAGSGTTAHAVMQLNAEDGGNRKYICVQLPEKCKPETEAAKAGFVTIADIAKERIRRAGKKIQEENPEKVFDVGFKVFKLDESNFKIWNTHVTSVEQLEQQMMEMFDNVREGSTKEAMMYELLLKSGKELNVAIEEKEAGGEKYFRINDGSLVICLADKLSKELFTGILVEKPKKIIVLDKSFGNDDQLKTNLLLKAEGAGVDEVRVI